MESAIDSHRDANVMDTGGFSYLLVREGAFYVERMLVVELCELVAIARSRRGFL
jgi:hypothetical protein